MSDPAKPKHSTHNYSYKFSTLSGTGVARPKNAKMSRQASQSVHDKHAPKPTIPAAPWEDKYDS